MICVWHWRNQQSDLSHFMTDNPDDLLKAAAKLDRKELLILLTSAMDALKNAISEYVKVEAENKNLKRVIRNIRMQVNCDN